MGDGDMNGRDVAGVLPDISGVWGVGGGLVVVLGLDSGLGSEVRDSRSVGFLVMGL
jgi:hypothetical protein